MFITIPLRDLINPHIKYGHNVRLMDNSLVVVLKNGTGININQGRNQKITMSIESNMYLTHYYMHLSGNYHCGMTQNIVG